MHTEDILTVNRVASCLKVTPQYVRKLIKENRLKSTRVGKQWLINPIDLKKFIKDDDFFIEPDDHERLDSDIPPIIALSFFSGAMGLDIGMERGGIKSLLACEFNKYCRMTIAKNRPNMALIGDINQYSAEDILKMAKIPKGHKIDVIFGGPPCQAFSTAGNRRGFDDERGNVFLRYIKIVSELKPRYVVIENVRGLLSTPYPYRNLTTPVKGGALCIIIERLKQAGYTISFNLYNAANYGAPQIRERVVIIGKLGNEMVPYLYPTNSNISKYNLPDWNTLGMALEKIKNIKEHHHINFPENRLKFYRILKEGQYWKNLPPELQVEAMGSKLKLGGGKTGFYRRLSFEKPSPTLVTNPTMPATDLCHPIEDRPLSVEEYSCIQGFPLNWKICGPILEQYKQIGNAVPIKLGEAIAKTIIADMKGENKIPPEDFPYSRYKHTSDVTWYAEMKKKIKKALELEDGNKWNPSSKGKNLLTDKIVEKRSAIMRNIHSKDTKPELLLRKALWHRGLRYRKNYKMLPGSPDIAITRYRIAVFVDGDFWHAKGHQEHPGEQIGSNKEYWQKKLKRNVERDKEVNDELTDMGWLVLRLWESDIKKDLQKCVGMICEYCGK